MGERNVINGAVASILAPFMEQWQMIMVWLVVAFALIMGDLRFGIMAARKRGETIRPSRAARRTINKLVDYICWVSIAIALGGSFGAVFGVPLVPAIVMLIVCGIELSSIFDNYFEYKGVKKKFNVFKFLGKLFRVPEIEESMEDKVDESK